MGLYPGAIQRPITRFRTKMKPLRANLHTAVSNTTSLYGYFAIPGNVCSHFYLRESGEVEQYVDTTYRAAADLEGNPDTISIETWDGYKRLWFKTADLPPWNQAQIIGLANLLAWIHTEHGIPLELAATSLPGARGISWHRLGINPWKIKGGLLYSNSYGKVCPGDSRIAQIPHLVMLAAAKAGGGGGGYSPVVIPPISRGYSVAYVKEVQSLLNRVFGSSLLVDGLLGPITVAVVRAYQASRLLVVDGDPGPITVGRLRAEATQDSKPVIVPPKVDTGPFPLRVDGVWGSVTTRGLQVRLSVPSHGVLDRVTVTALQAFLRVPVDGDFGPVSRRALQSWLGVPVDGFVGPVTVRAFQTRLNEGNIR